MKSDQAFKADSGKSNPLLLMAGFPNALERVNRTLDYGAIKYEAHSWKNVPDGVNRYDAAAMRHQRERMKGTRYDDESWLHHRSHEIVCLLMAFELELRDIEQGVRGGMVFNPNPPQSHKDEADDCVMEEPNDPFIDL